MLTMRYYNDCLRYFSQVLERHQRGILSMAWSRDDPDLFLTCGKDNRLICWNANTDVVGGEVG